MGEWDSPLSEYSDESEGTFTRLTPSPTPPSPTPPSQSFHSPNPLSIISTSASFSSLNSPTTLDELRYLRQAALDLEKEAKQPFRSPVVERKIKRKAVPSLELSTSQPATFSDLPDPCDSGIIPRPASVVDQVSASRVASRPTSLYELIPDIPTDPPTFHNRQSSYSPIASPSSSPFYQNHKATRSVIEVSPRTVSPPFSIPTRNTSHRSASSSSPSSSGGPTTPI